jgi:peptidyl-prolyl cis-trans isomerase B (cyclophilin B)
MSQQNKRSRGKGGSSPPPRSGSPSPSRSASAPPPRAGAKAGPPRASGQRTPPVRRTGERAPQRPVRSGVDRVLPPFSTQRYVAIWLAGMVPLVFLILVLTQCNGGAPSAAQVTPTTVAAGDASAYSTAEQPAQQTPGPTQMPLASTPAGTSGAAATAVGGAPAAGAGKFMVIDTAKGRIVAKLHTEAEAGVSKTIANFEQKANSGFFDGLVFHRVEDWVIQGGDPQGTGSGGGKMPSEYNQLPFKTGALGVARGPDPALNSDSQFFFVKTDSDFLNGQYTNFGQVTEGMNVVNQIAIGDKMDKVRVENR